MYGVLGFANPAATRPVGCGSPQVVVVKFTGALGCGRNARLAGLAAAFDVPLLAEEEEQLVLLNRATQRIAEVIAAQNVFAAVGKNCSLGPGLRCRTGGEILIGVQGVVAAEVEDDRRATGSNRCGSRC